MHLNQTVSDTACKAVLLAEDNKINQLLVKKMLAPFNIQLVIAENAHDVLLLLEQQHFDLVLIDIVEGVRVSMVRAPHVPEIVDAG